MNWPFILSCSAAIKKCREWFAREGSMEGEGILDRRVSSEEKGVPRNGRYNP